MRKLSPILFLTAFAGLSACDELEHDGDRAVVGAAIGCAAGYTLVNGRCVEGAVAGAVVGALSDDL